ncbi:aspartate aminotransferase family protein [Dongia soli]|uniref:Aspartate aminotransferase family protein n=1 Tax=Dongia soli TaxID=600628 RepID=A0ABU5EAZ2_9PROT|nr:aspartate aminotransferase family protein [Dongia soli]MDY0883516.1 aspartate aminotransferase family protein [Dongia soli]
MSYLFPRDMKTTPPTILRGEGSYLIDDQGRRYLDASGGPAVSCLGHNHPAVTAAIQQQAAAVSYAYSLFFTTPVIEELAETLVTQAPAGIEKAFFVSGGSEAVEAALKLARQYFLEIGQPSRHRFIARRRSYHGNTLGALALGGDTVRRQPYEPLLQSVTHIAPCYEYRDRRPDESAEAYGLRVADELEAAILAQGPENVAAFFCEPVVGASLGCAPAVPGYLKRIRDICDRYGVLLVFDEVMCGMGRTGHMYACLEDGVTPDIITTAKGLGGGYMPIGGLLIHGRIYRAIAEGSGALKHGHTYAGHTLACAGALAVQKVIAEEGLLAQVREQGAKLTARLQDRFGQHPHIGDIRGRGLFLGLELVADRESKACFDPAKRIWLKIRQTAMEQGLMCYPSGGCVDGRNGDHIVLAPPYNITDSQLDELVDKLSLAIGQVLGRGA